MKPVTNDELGGYLLRLCQARETAEVLARAFGTDGHAASAFEVLGDHIQRIADDLEERMETPAPVVEINSKRRKAGGR